jgi:hypothetical protein
MAVEGESLRGRLTREKQLPIEEAVRTATEVETLWLRGCATVNPSRRKGGRHPMNADQTIFEKVVAHAMSGQGAPGVWVRATERSQASSPLRGCPPSGAVSGITRPSRRWWPRREYYETTLGPF